MTPPRHRPRIVLTGGIASGKSSVARLLAEKGAVVIDADVIAREVVEPGTTGLAAVVDRFGQQILDDTGALDRATLGRIVFADPQARRDLEAIIHPLVRARTAELAARAPADAVVVNVIPLLVETGQAEAFDEVIVVDVDEATQVARMRSRDGLTEDEARARLEAQATREQRLAVATQVIDNATSFEALARRVDELWDRLSSRHVARTS